MSFVDWFIDSIASEDVIDLYFILSDMIDLDLTEDEIMGTTCLDRFASLTNESNQNNQSDIPIGKRVY